MAPRTKKVYKKKKAPPKPSPTKNLSTVTFGRGFPDKVICTHKYHTFVSVTGTLGATGSYQFRANGMYDPDLTGLGHQPLYFDQIGLLYDHWRVFKSTMTLKVTSRSGSNPVLVAGVFLNDDTSGTTNGETLCEQKRAKYVTIPQGTNANVYTLSCNFNAATSFGREQYNEKLVGTGSADPLEQQIYTLFVYSPLSGTGTIDVEVTINYSAVWTELKDVAAS